MPEQTFVLIIDPIDFEYKSVIEIKVHKLKCAKIFTYRRNNK